MAFYIITLIKKNISSWIIKLKRRRADAADTRWLHSCQLDLLFYDKSAGDVAFLLKCTVQNSEEINHNIAFKFSQK